MKIKREDIVRRAKLQGLQILEGEQRAQLPEFTGKTAYDLLMWVADVIEQEPKRYNQSAWLELINPHSQYVAAEMVPACGTVGCRAGWILTAIDGPEAAELFLSRSIYRIAERARTLIGGKIHYNRQPDGPDYRFNADITNLFAESSDYFCAHDDDGDSLHTGTPEYAAEGARGTRAFAAKWEERLRAHALPAPVSIGYFNHTEDINGNPLPRPIAAPPEVAD